MKDVVVLAGDESLLTVICSEMTFLGLSVGDVGERECRLLIADADNRTALAGAECIKYKKLLYVSRENGDFVGRPPCDAMIRRPISVRELRGVAMGLLDDANKLDAAEKICKRPSTDSGEIAVDKEERTVCVGRDKIGLSEKEFSVFSLLLSKRGEVVSRGEISAAIGAGDSNEADVYICFLRRKLERDGKRMILTARGIGYKLI